MKFQRLALIGCGLMGGSFALALRKADLVQSIVGFSVSEKTRQRALELKVIDQACTNVAEAVQGADLVLLAVDAHSLGDDLRWEPSRGGALFPHLYRALRLADIVWDKSLPLGASGHIFPEGVF